MKISTRALKTVPLFQGLDEKSLKEILHQSVLKRLQSDCLFKQGEKANYIYAVRSGRVKISQVSVEGHQVLLRWASAGDLIGGAPLFGAKNYPATATVLASASFLCWSKTVIDSILTQYPQVARNTIRFLGAELGQMRDRFRELATENVERRIARAVLRLVRQSGKKEKNGVSIDFPLSRQDLAEMTGTTLHTVSRLLAAWQRRGMVTLGRKKVLIREPHQLVSLADDLLHP